MRVFRSGLSLRTRKSSSRCGHSRAQCESSPQMKHPWVFEDRALPFSLSAVNCSGLALSSREGFLAGNLRSLSSRERDEERYEYRWDERCEL